jgi:hypothetical protein
MQRRRIGDWDSDTSVLGMGEVCCEEVGEDIKGGLGQAEACDARQMHQGDGGEQGSRVKGGRVVGGAWRGQKRGCAQRATFPYLPETALHTVFLINQQRGTPQVFLITCQSNFSFPFYRLPLSD